MIESVATSVLAALVYSLVFYFKKVAKPDGETFEPFKVLSTVLVGLGVSVFLLYLGLDVSQLTFEQYMTANIGMIAVVESMLKTMYRQYVKNFSG